nr:hypothetical protein [Tanacetum cinerariifolium]
MQFLNEIDRLSREFYYADHMNAILDVYTELDEVTNLKCDYLEMLDKCECLEKELSKSKMMSKSFEALQKQAINLEIDLQQCQEKIKNDKSFKENQSKEFRKERKQYFEIQNLKAQLQDKAIAIRVIPPTSVSRPQLKGNPIEDRVLLNNSQGKKQEVEDHRRNVKLPKNKTSVTAYFKNENNSLKLSNNQFKEANNKLSEENDLLYADFKKSQAELKRRDIIEYASEMELECAKVRAPESDEVIRLEKESRSKLSDLIRPYDYTKLNNL